MIDHITIIIITTRTLIELNLFSTTVCVTQRFHTHPIFRHELLHNHFPRRHGRRWAFTTSPLNNQRVHKNHPRWSTNLSQREKAWISTWLFNLLTCPSPVFRSLARLFVHSLTQPPTHYSFSGITCRPLAVYYSPFPWLANNILAKGCWLTDADAHKHDCYDVYLVLVREMVNIGN